MNEKLPGLSMKFSLIISTLLLVGNLILGIVLVNTSSSALRSLIDERMLDISNTAANMLNGDELEALKAEDKGTKPYQTINDTLAFFQESIDLEYIYCISSIGNGEFVFSVDPTIEDPGEFGSPIVSTPALITASEGEPAVDAEPYTDEWGKFYSAYSPVFDSAGKVAGIVAVDFSAEWLDSQIVMLTRVIIISAGVLLMTSIVVVMILTSRLRRQLTNMTGNLLKVSEDVHDLISMANSNEQDTMEDEIAPDDLEGIGKRIAHTREELHSYMENVHPHANSIIVALEPDKWRSICYVNLSSNKGVCYQTDVRVNDGFKRGKRFSYVEKMKAYAERYVTENYREDFIQFVNPDTVRAGLTNEHILTFHYTINRDGSESSEMMRIAEISALDNCEEQNNTVTHVGIGIANVEADSV